MTLSTRCKGKSQVKTQCICPNRSLTSRKFLIAVMTASGVIGGTGTLGQNPIFITDIVTLDNC